MKILTLLKAGADPVFYSLESSIYNRRTEIYNGLADGSIVAENCFGETMDPASAASDFVSMLDYYYPNNRIEKIFRNLTLSPVIISIVREEIFKAGDLDPLVYLSKLSTLVDLVNLGLFWTAVEKEIPALIRDSFLTEERLGRWSLMLSTADALK